MTNQEEQCGATNGTYCCQRDAGHETDPRKNQPVHAAITVSGNRPMRFAWGNGKEFWTKVHV